MWCSCKAVSSCLWTTATPHTVCNNENAQLGQLQLAKLNLDYSVKQENG